MEEFNKEIIDRAVLYVSIVLLLLFSIAIIVISYREIRELRQEFYDITALQDEFINKAMNGEFYTIKEGEH